MSNEVLESLSDAFADLVEIAGKSTVMVNGRRRMPSTGIVYTSDLVITANHTIEKEDDVKNKFTGWEQRVGQPGWQRSRARYRAAPA